MDLPTYMPGRNQKKHVSLDHCKRCHNPGDGSDVSKYLPAGLSKYVLHSFMEKSGKLGNIDKSLGNQLVRGRGGKLAVMYETHWEDLSSITWGREIDLKNLSRHILE